MFAAVLVLLLIGQVNGELVKKLTNVIKLTDNGDHSFPIFSNDGTKIYFTAKNGQYGTKCEHVYQMDIKKVQTYSTPSDMNDKISLISSGIGREIRPVKYGNATSKLISIVGTTFYELDKSYNSKNQKIDNDNFCPEIECRKEDETDKIKGKMKRGCAYSYHHSHGIGEKLMYFDLDGQFKGIDEVKAETNQMWINQIVKFEKDGVYSGTCDDSKSGECIYKGNAKGDRNSTQETDGTWDGFELEPIYDYKVKSTGTFYFHGYRSDDAAVESSISNGIIDLMKSKIYKSDFDQIEDNEPILIGYPLDGIDIDNNAYIFPHLHPNQSMILVTGINSQKKRALYWLDPNNKSKGVPITNEQDNSFHGAIDPTGNYVVFVSDKDGDGNNLYYGQLNEDSVFPPIFKPITPFEVNFGHEIRNAIAFVSSDKKEGGYDWSRLSKDKVLTFVAGECPQIYRIDTKENDLYIRQKLSSGIHAHESPDFLSNDDIVFASTLSRKISDPNKAKCSVRICDYKTEELKTLCDGVVEKSLPSVNELYVSTKFGSIKRRLTNNDFYDGEARVSSDGTFVVYTTCNDNGCALRRLDPYTTPKNTSPTELKGIGYGFQGDIVFSHDGKLIAYYATRYANNDNDDSTKKFKDMIRHGFTDVAKTELYVYSFNKEKEYKVTSLNGMIHSPIFFDDRKMMFLFNDIELHGVQFSLDKNEEYSFEKPFLISNFNKGQKIRKMFYNMENRLLSFTNNENVYVSEPFEPTFPKNSKNCQR